MALLFRSLLGIALGLVAASALGLAIYRDVEVLPFALFGWLLSLANGAIAVLLLYFNRRPREVLGVSVLLLLPYPILQYYAARGSSDGEVVVEIATLIIGSYLISSIAILASLLLLRRPIETPRH